MLIITTIASPTYFGPLFAKPPDFLGIPFGVVIDAIAMLWMLIGVVLIWDTRSSIVQGLVSFFFTIPATMVVVLSPAVVLILQNLG